MAEISTRAVRALTDTHTDKQTTVTLLRMRRGLIILVAITTSDIIFMNASLQREKSVAMYNLIYLKIRPSEQIEHNNNIQLFCPLYIERLISFRYSRNRKG